VVLEIHTRSGIAMAAVYQDAVLMTEGDGPKGKWAKFGRWAPVVAVVAAITVGAANLDGTITLAERVFGGGHSSSGSVTSPATTSPTDPVTSETPTDTPTEPTTTGTPTAPVTSETPTDPATSETPKPPAPLKVESIVLEFGDSPDKIGPGKYQVTAGRKANVKFWWTTFTNEGKLDGRNCTVVVQIRTAKTKTLITDGDLRTATCSLAPGWTTFQVPEGSFLLSVKVEASSGSTRTELSTFAVYGGA
jgi:hypothetical protein